jgi:hypothetical protein
MNRMMTDYLAANCRVQGAEFSALECSNIAAVCVMGQCHDNSTSSCAHANMLNITLFLSAGPAVLCMMIRSD